MKETWLKPPEIKDLSKTEVLHHRLSIEVDGKEIGKAELIYFGRPIRFYLLENLRIDPDYRGFRFSSRAIESINKFLDNKKTPGVLVNVISEDSKSRGLYERHDWKPTSFKDILVYSKKDLPKDVLAEMILRLTKWYNHDSK
ncbi:MAG: hypothetical protein UX09_C0004G0004 [Candidatus Uhrbacteria bacterium GW2011_GWE2_45_35]|uniref:N-acetyltransferase domain-containing protein n=2 Tax=Candidatus Uhriibacteriota TaxID=1752732 RepID=A0A0G1JKG0_9BACT|nr:MAG: hypothetical protein UW63_C0002G0024 [Candidatus Uhrbacteria bacterium GW2011_GWF2_44_350]KKU09084.1 MAG: hypothetical protein UX09_C0004G0004 [Candidatus Uhrbacteria bacterium GW2011_GWE2_45_35]HBR80335.1 hypothetical protein [Candidatus Uhrbacteria bacterium]HCU31731.1 hypothetical protein [Candidatus Uhrbacteria bacterium]